MLQKLFIIYTALFLLTFSLDAQTTFCPDDPPLNSWLADSPYPIYHRNSYAQASSCIKGILPGDTVTIKTRTNITGGTSPWIYLTDKYPNGERCILFSNSTHVFKLIDDGNSIVAIDSFRIDFDPITSFGYNHLLTRDHIWFSYDPDYNPENGEYTRLLKFSDEDVNDPYSDIILLDEFSFEAFEIPAVNMYNLNYYGEIVWYSERDTNDTYAYAGVIDQDFNMLDTLRFEVLPAERVNHNSISVDEENNFYIVTSHRLIQFTWDGNKVLIGWQALYDFVNDGPTGNFAYGSGTTPTLMGWGEGNDKLVVVADGHANNNLVAFWRELPDGWTGIPNMPLHFADSISIPNAMSFSNLFQSIENSPTVHGYDVAIAQFNGFLGYDCENLKGVSKFNWNQEGNEFELQWTNDEVNMNGVLAYSSGSDLVYGSGKEEDCNYYYYGLDWQTGELKVDVLLGPEGTFLDDPFYDAGVNNVIDEDGSIYFPGGGSVVKLERHPLSTATIPSPNDSFSIYPNPSSTHVFVNHLAHPGTSYTIYSIDGIALRSSTLRNTQIDISDLPAGLLVFQFEGKDGIVVKKVYKD
ncbi:MAG: T9SS type A sorting domain-containing protein [Bacteroidota bacterium]